jgi:hypothetical protein
MSYKAYEFYNTAGTRAAYFAAIKAFLVAIGWTLHDAIDADTVVYKSNGESGNEPTGYIYIDAGTSTYIQFMAYQYWDATSHAGRRGTYAINASSSQITATFNTQKTQGIVFAGDKDFVVMCNPTISQQTGSGICFGHIPGRFDPTLTKAMGTAGTPGTLLVSSTASMGVGKTITICGSAGEGCDKLVIASVPDANNITVTALPRNYGTGAIIGGPASVFGIAAINSANFYPTSFYGDAGTSVSGTAVTFIIFSGAALHNLLLQFPQKYYSVPIIVAVVSATSPGIYMGMFHQNILAVYGSASANDCMIANADESISVASTATGGTETTLSDSAKSWGVDALIGKFVIITANTGIGQVRKITGNDGTSITVGAWQTTPDSTSEYKICDYVYRISMGVLGTTMRVGMLLTNTEVPS